MDAFSGWLKPPHDLRRRDVVAPVARDEHLGAIFRQMRAVVGLNEIALARLLGTDLSVIMDLEGGIAEGLPPWPELVRIVERYASIAGVEPSPIITRLMQLSMPAAPPPSIDGRFVPRPPAIQANASAVPDLTERFAPPRPRAIVAPVLMPTPAKTAAAEMAPRHATAVPTDRATASRYVPPLRSVPAPAVVVEDAEDRPPPQRRRWLSRTSALAALLVLLLGLYFAMLELPRVAYASVGYFPVRLREPVRNVIDLAIQQTSAVRDGLRWIDVGDPRLRKTDRLKSQ